MTTSLEVLFHRELDRLVEEIEAFKEDPNMWKTPDGIANSSGNLVLHLVGNLNHFVGSQLGNTGYVRNRKAEFADKGISREVMISEVVALKPMISKVLQSLNPQVLKKDYPLEFLGAKKSVEGILIHLYGHLNYHLGQINYLRRLLEG